MDKPELFDINEWKRRAGWDSMVEGAKAEMEVALKKQGDKLPVFTKIAKDWLPGLRKKVDQELPYNEGTGDLQARLSSATKQARVRTVRLKELLVDDLTDIGAEKMIAYVAMRVALQEESRERFRKLAEKSNQPPSR